MNKILVVIGIFLQVSKVPFILLVDNAHDPVRTRIVDLVCMSLDIVTVVIIFFLWRYLK